MDARDVGRRVAARLADIGMTRAELADTLGCDRSKISNLTRGARQRLDLEFLQSVAGAIGLDIADLVASGGGSGPAPVSTAAEAIAAMRSFADAWHAWVDTERERVANERLRIEADAETRRQQIREVDAVDAQARLLSRESERDASQGMRIALEALSHSAGVPLSSHGAGRTEAPARRARTGS